MVTAKFKVSRKIPWGMWFNHKEQKWEGTPSGWEVEFTPDYAEGRNAEWAAATPSGMIRMTIKNQLAADFFHEGQAITVTFSSEDE